MMFYNYKKNFFYHEKIDHKICDMLINFYENSPNKTRGRVGISELQKDFKVCSEVNPSFKKGVTHSAISSLHTTLDSSCRKLIDTYPFIGKLYHWKIDDGFNIQVYAPGEAFRMEHCEHGADDAFIYPTGNLDKDQQKELSSKIKELTGGAGANVVYDPIGDAYSEPCIRATAWDGRYLVIGFAAGQIPKIPINLALLKGMKIVGVFWGAWVGMFPEENKKNFEELFRLHADGKINPEVSDSFSLDDGANAIAHLKDRKAKGKVIIKI